jgi:cell division protein FtsB
MQKQSGGNLAKWTVAGIVLIAAAAAFSFLMVRPNIEEKRRLEAVRDELKLRVAAESAEVDDINNRCARFKDDKDFVEHEARRNHRISPGETEFIFDAPE